MCRKTYDATHAATNKHKQNAKYYEDDEWNLDAMHGRPAHPGGPAGSASASASASVLNRRDRSRSRTPPLMRPLIDQQHEYLDLASPFASSVLLQVLRGPCKAFISVL